MGIKYLATLFLLPTYFIPLNYNNNYFFYYFFNIFYYYCTILDYFLLVYLITVPIWDSYSKGNNVP